MPGRTGGYYWVPGPGEGALVWEVATCHELGFDSETGRVDMWSAVVDRLARLWGRDGGALRRALEIHPYGLSRGRVTRPGDLFLINHGGDWPRDDGLERGLLAFGIDPEAARALLDKHKRTMRADRARRARALESPELWNRERPRGSPTHRHDKCTDVKRWTPMIEEAGAARPIIGGKRRGRTTMNWDQVAGNWKQFRGKVKEKWGDLTDDELDKIDGQQDQLVGVLQKKYGYARDKAEEEVEKASSGW